MTSLNKPSKPEIPVLSIFPAGYVKPLIFMGGMWGCGGVKNGMSVEEQGSGGGVISNDDLIKLRAFINKHLREVRKLEKL